MPVNFFAVRRGLALLGLGVLASCSTDDNDATNDTAAATGPSTARVQVSAYDIVKVPAMTIDGDLGDWAEVSAISMADDPNNGRGALNNSATVKLAWNDTYLYAAYNVTDTDLRAIQTTRDHDDIFRDDDVQLYVDPQGDGGSATSMTSTDYQFLANLREAVGDLRGNGSGGKDASFNAASFVAQVVTNGSLNGTGADVGYTVELRISWSDLGVTPAAGHFLRIDPAVGDRDGDPAPAQGESFDWAGLTGFNNPSAWRDVQLVDPPPRVSAYDIVKVPGMAVDGNLGDWAGVAAIQMADDPNNGRGALNNSATVKLAWNDTYLYAAYNVTDTDLRAIQTTRDHDDIFRDDDVQLYVDPQGDGGSATSMTSTDYQFLANLREAVGDFRGNGSGGKDASFNAASFVAQVVTNGSLNATGADVGYTVELRISWSDLGITPATGHFLRIDPAVGDRDGDPAPAQGESFDWAGLTSFNNPSAWKDVKLVIDNTPPAAPTNLSLAVVSSSQIDASWSPSSAADLARYRIYRGTTGTPTLVDSVPASPYHDTGLAASTAYTYEVSAVDVAGNTSQRSAPATATTSPSGSPSGALRVGMFRFGTEQSDFGGGPAVGGTGIGPGAPPYRAALYVPPPTRIAADITLADQHDILLILNLVGSKADMMVGESYSAAKYEQRMRRFTVSGGMDPADAAALADAFQRKRAIIYLVDEPQHSAFNGSLSPTEVNQMGLLAKSIWPGVVTLVRADGDKLNNDSWGGGPTPPAGGWSGVDYGWIMHEPPQHTRGDTIAKHLAEQKALLAAANLGAFAGLNWLNGGPQNNIDGVAACWDTQNDGNGANNGYLKGTSENGAGGPTPAMTHIPCGSRNPLDKWLVASPAYIRRYIQVIKNDPDIPATLFWQHTSTQNTEFQPVERRADLVAAFDDAIDIGATRTNWVGWRPIK